MCLVILAIILSQPHFLPAALPPPLRSVHLTPSAVDVTKGSLEPTW